MTNQGSRYIVGFGNFLQISKKFTINLDKKWMDFKSKLQLKF